MEECDWPEERIARLGEKMGAIGGEVKNVGCGEASSVSVEHQSAGQSNGGT